MPRFGILCNPPDCVQHLSQKLIPKSRRLIIVILDGFINLELSYFKKANLHDTLPVSLDDFTHRQSPKFATIIAFNSVFSLFGPQFIEFTVRFV